jgi:hypothetical protein
LVVQVNPSAKDSIAGSSQRQVIGADANIGGGAALGIKPIKLLPGKPSETPRQAAPRERRSPSRDQGDFSFLKMIKLRRRMARGLNDDDAVVDSPKEKQPSKIKSSKGIFSKVNKKMLEALQTEISRIEQEIQRIVITTGKIPTKLRVRAAFLRLKLYMLTPDTCD